MNFKWNVNQDGHQTPRYSFKIDRLNISQIQFQTNIFHFLIPACKFHDMLAIQFIQLQKSEDSGWCPQNTSSTFAWIQDGCQDTKLHLIVYNVVRISLFLNYKFDIYVKMYHAKDSEFKYMNPKWNENQDGYQIPRCLSKVARINSSQVLFCKFNPCTFF